MKNWQRQVRNAVVMGLAWAVVWAPVAVLIGTKIVDPDDSMDEMWVLVGAYPGFICAVIFSAVRAVAERSRGLAELSLARAGAWGALAGVLVGVFPFTVGTPTNAVPLWLLGVTVIGAITIMSAISAIGSVFLARMAKKRQFRDATTDLA